jgi:MFS family permease
MLKWILAITVVEQTMVSAIRPMVTYRALALGSDPLDLGLIAACFALVSLIAAVVGGSWFDRWPGRRIGILGSAIMGVACIVSLFADSVLLLTLVIVGSQSLLAARAEPRDGRDGGFGMYMAASSLGQLIGPLFGAFAVTQFAPALGFGSGPTDVVAGAQVVFATALGLSGCVAVLIVGIPRMRAVPGSARPSAFPSPASVRGTLGLPLMPLAMVSSLVLSASVDVLIIYVPAYGEWQGWSIEFVGIVLTTRALAAMAARLCSGLLLARLGTSRALVASMVVSALALAATPAVGSGAAPLALMAVAGFWLGLGVPVTLSWVGALAPVAARGSAMGLRLAANRLGHMVLPVLAGGIGGVVGLGSVFWALGGVLAATAAALVVIRPEASTDG